MSSVFGSCARKCQIHFATNSKSLYPIKWQRLDTLFRRQWPVTSKQVGCVFPQTYLWLLARKHVISSTLCDSLRYAKLDAVSFANERSINISVCGSSPN